MGVGQKLSATGVEQVQLIGHNLLMGSRQLSERADVAVVVDGLPDLAELLDRKRDGRRVSCIYFLCRGRRVVYVGQTVNLERRLSTHFDKRYDAVWFVRVEPEYLTVLEQQWIGRLTPEYNGPGGRRNVRARPRHVRFARCITASDDEWAEWSARAKADGFSGMSAWLRALAERDANRAKPA